MISQDPIQKGLNAGYVLQKHAPALAEKLMLGFKDKNHPYAKAFIKGRQACKLELLKAKKSNKGKGKSKGKARSKDQGLEMDTLS